MLFVRKNDSAVTPVFDRLEAYLWNYRDNKMSTLALLLIFTVTGFSMAYIMLYFNVILVSVGKRQLTLSEAMTTKHGTSIMKRTRQKTIPVNPGGFFLF